MGLRLFFLPNFPAATFIQGATFIPDSRVSKSENLLQVKKKIPAKVFFTVRYTNTNNCPHFFLPLEVNNNKNCREMGLLSLSNLEICIKKAEFSDFKG